MVIPPAMATNTQNQHVMGDEEAISHGEEKQNSVGDDTHNDDKHVSDTKMEYAEGHHSTISSITGQDDDNDDDDDASYTASSHRGSNNPQDGDETAAPVTRISTNVSLGPDNPVEHYTSYTEVPDSVYNKFSPQRKLTVVVLLSYCAFLAPISSTTVLSATPEVAAEYKTTGSIVNVTNALYLLFMGISPIVWGPFSEVWGRKVVCCQFCPSQSLLWACVCVCVCMLEAVEMWDSFLCGGGGADGLSVMEHADSQSV